MNKEEFLLYMSMEPLVEYGNEIKKMMDCLDDETIEECLEEGRPKYICSAIEKAYTRMRMPSEWSLNIRKAEKVIMENEMFSDVERDVWMGLDNSQKQRILNMANRGVFNEKPSSRSAQVKWMDVSALLITILTEEIAFKVKEE